YTQLTRPPYFNLVRQLVIDPMHKLVKIHFYIIYIKMNILRENHELCMLYKMLADFNLPSTMGKLLKNIGQPFNGLLTADQWKLSS
ncbi:hypothetical protein OBBRIDRAFT_735834, partial [Obba rivulosa]